MNYYIYDFGCISIDCLSRESDGRRQVIACPIKYDSPIIRSSRGMMLS